MVGAKYRGISSTYANEWLIMYGVNRTLPGSRSESRQDRKQRRVLPRFGALRGDNTPNLALRGLRITMINNKYKVAP